MKKDKEKNAMKSLEEVLKRMKKEKISLKEGLKKVSKISDKEREKRQREWEEWKEERKKKPFHCNNCSKELTKEFLEKLNEIEKKHGLDNPAIYIREVEVTCSRCETKNTIPLS